MEFIRSFASSSALAKPATRATVVQSRYEEVVVRGSDVVGVRLTPEATRAVWRFSGSRHAHAHASAAGEIKVSIGVPDGFRASSRHGRRGRYLDLLWLAVRQRGA